MARFSEKQLKKLCLKGIISPSVFSTIKKLRRQRYKPLHERKLFDISSFSDRESKLMFRFTPSEILRMVEAFGIPEKFRLRNRIEFQGVEGFAILLRRLCYPNRYYDLVKLFGRDITTLSRIFNRMLHWIYVNFGGKVRTLKQDWLTKEKLSEFAEACSSSGSVYPNIVGFIDGTCRPICRPKRHQEMYYSGYYKEHLVKYQGVMLPNGVMARVDGPFIGRRHDSAIIHFSKIIPEMEASFVNTDGTWFALYGDAGYANQKFVKVGFKNFNRMTDLQKTFNSDMSSLRVSVEYGFGKVIQLFAFLDYKKNQKLLMQDLKEQYIVAVILTNCHTCINGSQVSKYFSCEPPSLEEYLNSLKGA